MRVYLTQPKLTTELGSNLSIYVSERRDIIARCKDREKLSFQLDSGNEHSTFAIKALRMNGLLLGHAVELLAE